MASAWIEHVKKYAAQNGIKFGDALKKAGPSFKKGDASPASPAKKTKKAKKGGRRGGTRRGGRR